MTYKIDEETAVDEFDRFAEEMDLDTELRGADDDDRNQFEKMKWRIVRAIRTGSLIINENGEAIYTPQKSKYDQPLHFRERTGASAMAADGPKKGRDVAKSYAMMADLAQVEPKTFAKLVGVDIKVCEAIFSLLMD